MTDEAPTSHYVTSHDSAGNAVFSTKLPVEPHKIPIAPSGNVRDGYIQVLYSTSRFKPDLTDDVDVDEYAPMRTNGPGPGRLCPPDGTSTLLLVLPAGQDGAPMHRTMTLDILVVLQGSLELCLDSGESRVLHQGDTCVQRATMHTWKNVTSGGGQCKLLAHILPIREPLVAGSRLLTAQHP